MKGTYKKNSGKEAKRKLAVLKRMQAVSLERKIQITNDIISRGLKKGKAAVLFSGGKDSTVLLHLLLQHDRKILIMHNDTTLGDQENLDYIRKTTKGLNYIETTAENPFKMWKEKGYYPILGKRGFTAYKKKIPSLKISPVQCCYQLKEMPANRVLKDYEINVVFWGNRAGESIRRRFSFIDNGFLFKPKKYPWWQCYSLQHFTAQDILVYLHMHVPGYQLLESKEAGCLCCATDITFPNNNLTKLYRSNPELWRKYMTCGFAREILKIKGFFGLTDEQILKIIEEKPMFLNRV